MCLKVNSLLTVPEGETSIESPSRTRSRRGTAERGNTAGKKVEKPWTPKPDFEAHVRGGFKRPYVCTFPGCDQAFSRQYTLAVHMKGHELSGYHKFKKEPLLFLDPDLNQMKQEAAEYKETKVSLPPLVIQEIEKIRALSSKASRRPSRESILDEVGGFY